MQAKKIGIYALTGVLLFTMAPASALADEQAIVDLPQTQEVQSTAAEAQPENEYRLSKYDVLNIVIVGNSDSYFSDIMIGPDGYVNLPYAGRVKLAGLTVDEATDLLTAKLGEYVRIPSMSLMIKAYGPRKVYVVGEVKNQGIYALSSEYMNIFAAISSAGGLTNRARTKKIAVVRVVNGKVNVQEIDFKKFVEQRDITQNIALQDGDMVYVPQSNKIIFNEDVLPFLSAYGLYRAYIK